MKEYNDWRDRHLEVITEFLTYLNNKTQMILF